MIVGASSPIAHVQESTILGRAEWIKFFAAFFDLEIEAERAYERIQTVVQTVSDWARETSSRPLVAFTSYSCSTSDSPCTGTETFSISTASYKTDAVKAAGGSIRHVDDPIYNGLPTSQYGFGTYEISYTPDALDPNNTAKIEANRASFLEKIADVDVLIDETYYASATDATLATILTQYYLTDKDTSYPFIKNMRIYREDKTSSASGQFEGQLLHDDTMVVSVCQAYHHHHHHQQ